MKKTILITSVTRMDEGYVCVSGLDEDGRFVRPEIPYHNERWGIKLEYLYDIHGSEVIRPLTMVELEFIKHIPQSPYHTEDWLIDGHIPPKPVSTLTDKKSLSILSKYADCSLRKALADNSRSLVIIRPEEIPRIRIKIWDDRIRCRFSFCDETGDYVGNLERSSRPIGVVDAYWLALCKYLWRKDKINIEQRLTKVLEEKKLFLLIGITREWQGEYWRQVSGVLTIPYWLDKYCFADFGYDFTDDV